MAKHKRSHSLAFPRPHFHERLKDNLIPCLLLRSHSYRTFKNVETPQDVQHPKSLLSDKYESLDYDPCENSLVKICDPRFEYKKHKIIQFQRWTVMLLIGVSTALVGCFIDISIDFLTELQYNWIKQPLDKMTQNVSDTFMPLSDEAKYRPLTSLIMKPYFMWLGCAMGLVILPALLVAFVEPMAGGSGISQIKCFLNGVKIPNIVRLKTLLIKIFGVVCAVSGGLIIGKEGPMIHIGSIIAAGVSQGCSTTLKCDLDIFKSFRTDQEKRDFVSAGTAAGIAAAFGAPVGGVLLSLEEGASFWNQALTWRIFFASMTSTFTLNVIMSAYKGHPGELSNSGLLNFGKLDDIYYSIKEIPIFLFMAVIGGVLGALFNHVNINLTLFRMRNVTKPFMRVTEALLVTLLTSSLIFAVLYFAQVCTPLDVNTVNRPIQMFCNDGEYNSVATLFFQTAEVRIRGLFHDTPGTYNMWSLLLISVLWFILSCWTFGICVPSGIFIPCLMVGAAWGRLIGMVLHTIFPNAVWAANPAKFALVGAAVQLGGVVRMTLSLTVMLIEATGNITFGLVLMLTLMLTKWVGDIFNEGIYDMQIHLSSVPFLEWEPPALTTNIEADQIMSHPVTFLRTIEKVGTIVDILKTKTHNGFPLVDVITEREKLKYGRFRGLILRSQLLVILRHEFSQNRPLKPAPAQPQRESPATIAASPYLKRKPYVQKSADSEGPGSKTPNNIFPAGLGEGSDVVVEPEKLANLTGYAPLTQKSFKEPYPRFFSIDSLIFSPEQLDTYIYLQPYASPAPYTVYFGASLTRVFRMFRALGLRHLPVINERNEVIGMITRKDLSRYRILDKQIQELRTYKDTV